ncbi:DUF3617 domain-containing protein [Undibacterium terreum]|uniref:DUF3617 domain-containing protein n=1 Tax=Undibacterium terreum TaxID=1224302 RepID=A0A916XGJ6_9BURK|nr:DUF3617 domain-containing protein [Undibacterium terreum]GGC71923.1 hypothetical protein GCM10011396_18760 [Undibacterium terreum]
MKTPGISLTLPLLSLALFAGSSYAAGIKPGLWEMTVAVDPKQAEMMAKMSKLTPEQQEQMNKMGIKLPQMQGNSMVHKVCLTKEMIERDQPPVMSKEQSMCQPKNFSKSSSGYSVDIICDSPDFKGSGTSRGTFVNQESFTSVYDFKGTARGRPITQHNESSAKWLGADCGDVKPMDPSAKK